MDRQTINQKERRRDREIETLRETEKMRGGIDRLMDRQRQSDRHKQLETEKRPETDSQLVSLMINRDLSRKE